MLGTRVLGRFLTAGPPGNSPISGFNIAPMHRGGLGRKALQAEGRSPWKCQGASPWQAGRWRGRDRREMKVD